MRFRHSLLSVSLLLVLVFSPSRARAETPPAELVFSISSSNDYILRVDFAGPTTAIVNTDQDAAGKKGLEGVSVRRDATGISLIVPDNEGGKIFFYEHAEGPARVNGQVIPTPPNKIVRPRGVTLDSAGNIFLVDTAAGGSSLVGPKVWKIPFVGTGVGGYGSPILIDGTVPSQVLEEAKVVSFTKGDLETGDVLVLSSAPAEVLRYAGGTPCSPAGSCASVFIPTTKFDGGVPSGFAFDSEGNLLIATTAGEVLRFNSFGNALTNFASGAGTGRVKIAVGFQGATERAFLTDEDESRIVRYDFSGGIGVNPLAVSEGVSKPNGAALGSSLGTTPVGANVKVNPAPSVEITFAKVTAGGVTNARITEFSDPRMAPGSFFLDDPALASLGLPHVRVPDYVEALQRNGQPTFSVIEVDTTATFDGAAQVTVEEELLGFLGGQCAAQTGNEQTEPRLFYAPETDEGEPDIVESFAPPFDNVFTDVSTGCGSHKGYAWCFSLLLTGTDNRSIEDITAYKLFNLGETFDINIEGFMLCPLPPNCARDHIDAALTAAEAAFADCPTNGAGCSIQGTYGALQTLIEAVEGAAPAEFDVSIPHAAGELVARSLSIQFMLVKLGAAIP